MESINAKHAGLENWNQLEWSIETIYGDLKVSIHSSDYTKSGRPKTKFNLVSIYTRFEDVDKAKEYLKKNDGNTWSGKHNYLSSGGEDIITLWNYNFEHFKYELEQILIKKDNLISG